MFFLPNSYGGDTNQGSDVNEIPKHIQYQNPKQKIYLPKQQNRTLQ